MAEHTNISTMTTQTSYSQDARREIIQNIFKLIQVLLASLLDLWVSLHPPRHDPIKYHTSILSGHAWLMELITRHPDHIKCELGLRKETFLSLVAEFCSLGHWDARDITLDEQIAIFLYMSVTGLTTRHVGECFQHANSTISWYVPTGFYGRYLSVNTDISRKSLIYYQVHCSIPSMCCFQPVNISHQRSITTQFFSHTSVMVMEAPTSFSLFSLTDCTLYSHFSFDDFIMVAFPDLTRDLDDPI